MRKTHRSNNSIAEGKSFLFSADSYNAASSTWGKKNESPGVKQILSRDQAQDASNEYADKRSVTPRAVTPSQLSSNMKAILNVPRMSQQAEEAPMASIAAQ